VGRKDRKEWIGKRKERLRSPQCGRARRSPLRIQCGLRSAVISPPAFAGDPSFQEGCFCGRQRRREGCRRSRRGGFPNGRRKQTLNRAFWGRWWFSEWEARIRRDERLARPQCHRRGELCSPILWSATRQPPQPPFQRGRRRSRRGFVESGRRQRF
jgi:hypothetical protein